jgi:hypothetical protein
VACAGVAASLLATSGLFLLIATGQRVLWWAVAAAGFGALVGSTGLLLVYELIAGRFDRPGRLDLGVAAGVGVGVAGALVTWLGIAAEWPWLAATGLILLILGLLPVNLWLGRKSLDAPAFWTGAGLAASLVAVVLVWVDDKVGAPLSLPGAAVWLAGLVAFKLGLGPWLTAEERWLATASAVAAGAAVVGVGALVYGARSSQQLALLVGLALPVLGLSALGISVLRLPISSLVAGAMIGAGLAAIAGGGLLVYDLVKVAGITIVASGIIAAISAWFVFRGEGLVAAVLIGFVLVWVLVDRTTGVAADPHPESASRILALGDSYLSGEGAAEYFEGTNTVGSEGNECRRAPTASAYLVAERLGMGLDFLACSGARTAEVDGGESDADPPGGIAGHGDQLGYLLATRNEAEIGAIDVVLVSVGGNDVGFSTIVKACLLPESCAVLEEMWLANVETLGDDLPATYRAIKEAVPATPIVVLPYPLILDNQACGLAIDASEHDFVVRFVWALNREIVAAASEAGVHVYPGAASAFEGHLLCDADPAANFLHLSPPRGGLGPRLLPSNWVHGSMHPRRLGHELVAAGLTTYLDDLLARVEGGASPNPEPRPPQASAMTTVELAEAEEAEELLTSDEWITDQLYRTADNLVLPVGLLLVGGWLAAAGTARQRWWLSRFLSPTIRLPPQE